MPGCEITCRSNVAPNPKDLRVKRAVLLIASRLNDPDLTASRLAEYLQLSPSRLRQLFICDIGVPPTRYIRISRLDQARVLLANSSLSVKEVMAAVGLSDPSHFSKDYKKRFGIAPGYCSDRIAKQFRDSGIGEHT